MKIEIKTDNTDRIYPLTTLCLGEFGIIVDTRGLYGITNGDIVIGCGNNQAIFPMTRQYGHNISNAPLSKYRKLRPGEQIIISGEYSA